MRRFLPLAALALAVPAAAQDAKPLTLEQTMLLRCSAMFAVVAKEQERGVPAAGAYPPMQQRGKEYFVRAGARLMDELGLTPQQFAARVSVQVDALASEARGAPDSKVYLAGVMQACLAALDASGL